MKAQINSDEIQVKISGTDRSENGAMPKDAAAVILLRHDSPQVRPEIFWARRSEKLAFLGGFHAFPGGQRDATDAQVKVANCADTETATMISCAARELFEETGVLVARGLDAMTKGQRASLLDDLESERMTFPALLNHFELHLDANDFTFVGRWVTPPFSPRRFDTWFFLVRCPAKQEPEVKDGELESGEWIAAEEAFARWTRSEVLCAPPVLYALQTLASDVTDDLIERFLAAPQAHREPARRIEFRPGFICFPLRTPTKPPATHTNCYLIGANEFIIIDPASPDEEEQAALAACVDALLSEGRHAREIILTHHHPDHIGGVRALIAQLKNRVSVAAHHLTAEALKTADFSVDRFIEDGEMIELSGVPHIALRAIHTPGHARGHLCFYEEKTGALITGDMIVGLGSILIDPPEGNMRDYLNSLERLAALPNLSVLFGAHGPAIGNARAKIAEYIAHRLEREENILQSVRKGAATTKEIVAGVYTDVPAKAHALAERAVLAHLEKLAEDNLITRASDGRYFAKDCAPAAS